MALSYDKKVLIKRGNTASVSSYIGPLGELVLDTDTKRVYVQDGVTAGGIIVTGSGYSNADVVAYLLTNPTITSLIANVATQSITVSAVQSNVATATTAINSLVAIAAAQSEQIVAAEANIVASSDAMKSYVDDLVLSTISGISTNGNYSNVNVAAYLAENPITSQLEVSNRQFGGDGNTVTFTLPKESTTTGTIVSINGIVQTPIMAYSIQGALLTFTEAPASDDSIDVRIFETQTGSARPLGVSDRQFSGDGITTEFILPSNSTTAGTIVSINGVVQIPTVAYAVNGTTLTFTEAPAADDSIDVRVFETQSIATDLKALVAASTSFEDFQAKIATL